MSAIYYVVNSSRSVHTRAARAQSPERARFQQFILGGAIRLVRGRPVSITEDVLISSFEELKAKAKQGHLMVRVGSPDGPIYDFSSNGLKKTKKVEEKREEKEEATEQKVADKEEENTTAEKEEESETKTTPAKKSSKKGSAKKKR